MQTIRINSTGDEVALLQKLLGTYGFSVLITGTFGNETREAVMAFQTKYGLPTDGIVNYYTWESLLFINRMPEQKINEEDYARIARLLDIETAVLKAVVEVESEGRSGFFSSGKPRIQFEGHIFWKQLQQIGRNPENFTDGNEDILYQKYTTAYYKEGDAEYERLNKARMIDKDSANASVCWGMFQMIGFNYRNCSEPSIIDFVSTVSRSEAHQVLLLARYIKNGNMLVALQQKNWVEFAKRYNGPAYTQKQYDKKLAEAYSRYAS